MSCGMTLRDGHHLTESELVSIKQHLFQNEHILDDYETGGTYRGRFDPDWRQAEAWGRLETGTATDLDRLFLEHELAEVRYLGAHPGAAYREAHNAANTVADWNAAYRKHTRGQT